MSQLAHRIHQAKQAQEQWGRQNVATRVTALRSVRQAVLDRADEIAALLHAELEKPKFEGYSMEVLSLLESLTGLEHNAALWLAPENVPLRLAKHRRSTLHYAPRGVVGLITPWNFPFAIAGSEVAAALVAGNAVIWKPSEWAERCAQLLAQLFAKAQLPPGLLQIHPGGPKAGADLVEADLDYLGFTGSTQTGRAIAKRCGERLLPHRVELGGKGSALVLPDAESKRSAAALVWGAFANAGQICAGVQRAYIVRKHYDQMVHAILREARKLNQISTNKCEAEIGPSRLPTQSVRVRTLVEEALAKGARLVFGSIPAAGSRQISPLILQDVPPDAAIAKEECFAPILCLVPVHHANEGIAQINALDFGLMASVFSRDLVLAREIAGQIRSGTVMINDVVWTYGMPETPWIGLRDSGLGLSHGAAGLRSYCEMRHINEPRGKWLAREPFWFPYTAKRLSALQTGIRALYSGYGWRDLKSLLSREKS